MHNEKLSLKRSVLLYVVVVVVVCTPILGFNALLSFILPPLFG